MPIKQEVAQSLTGHWQIGLFETPCKAPLNFCCGCCCTCCMAGKQRGEILDIIQEPYVCCGGLCPCGPLGQPQDRNCMWVEACCCTGWAISGNRYLIQTRFDRMNTACDDCIIWTVCLCSCFVMLSNCFCDGCVPEEVENCVDLLIMIVDGCMLGQQQHEIEYVRKNGYNGPSQAVMQTLSPAQQNFISQGKPPQQQSMGAGAGMAMGAGAMVGGAAGATAAHQMYGAPQQQQQQYGGQQQQVPMGQPMGGFMGTKAPNGQMWNQYCGSQAVQLGQQGYPAGAWGECICWAKYFEYANGGKWENDPNFSDGPVGQVIDHMLKNTQPGNQDRFQQAGESLEKACEQAYNQGRPFPIINTKP